MGQQQLLLLVFGVVIVAMGMLAGVAVFEGKARSHAEDQLLDQALKIAQEAVVWRNKAEPFKSGGDTYMGLQEDAFRKLGMNPQTVAGTYRIDPVDDNILDIVGQSRRFPEIGIVTRLEGERIVSTTFARDGSISAGDAAE
jgi:hypothetical protein